MYEMTKHCTLYGKECTTFSCRDVSVSDFHVTCRSSAEDEIIIPKEHMQILSHEGILKCTIGITFNYIGVFIVYVKSKTLGIELRINCEVTVPRTLQPVTTYLVT